MIKANELRIGNLISFYDFIQPERIVTVDARFFCSIAGGCREEINNYYSGISLTPEIIQDGLNLIDSPDLRDSISDLTKGKKLHQFQNLIFDLTGQELEFKQQPAIIHSQS